MNYQEKLTRRLSLGIFPIFSLVISLYIGANERFRRVEMDKSGTYAAFEQMIQMSFMVMQLSALDQILEKFERSGRLTPTEHRSLLDFAQKQWNMN